MITTNSLSLLIALCFATSAIALEDFNINDLMPGKYEINIDVIGYNKFKKTVTILPEGYPKDAPRCFLLQLLLTCF